MTKITDSTPITLESTNLSVIKTTGKDALEFLNNQFTNDLLGLASNHWQLSGYCNAKGRLFSIMRVFKHDDQIYLVMPDSVCDNVLKRLKIYVFRADVNFEELTNACVQFSTGKAAEIHIESMQQFEVRKDQTEFVLNLSPNQSRCLIIRTQVTAENNTSTDQSDEYAHWRLSEIQAGIPNIYATSIEKFIPQHLNLDQLNGISFTKGCFPGQEIIARLHYLGKSKKSMQQIEFDSSTPLNPGDTIKHPDSSISLVVVDAVSTHDQIYQCLAVGQFDQ